MDRWSSAGGILGVLELIADNRAAVTYDFRHRFNLSPKEFGSGIGWDEVILLFSVLLQDPTSWTQTAINKWKHPITYDWAVLAATYDLHAAVNSKKLPTPLPRPWDEPDTKGSSRVDARQILKNAKNGTLEWQNKHTPTSR